MDNYPINVDESDPTFREFILQRARAADDPKKLLSLSELKKLLLAKSRELRKEVENAKISH